MIKKPTALIILDGFGIAPESPGNAVNRENAPFFFSLWDKYPHTLLKACGEAVGLPEGQMGNSEVGHQNIGAGRVVPQELKIINAEISSGKFYSNPEFFRAIDNCKKHNSALHIMGLASPGGVHSHIKHLEALLQLAKEKNMQRVYIHCFTDGRDTDPDSAKQYIVELQKYIDNIGCGKIVTICGRYYAMDRDNNFDRTGEAYDMLTLGIGENKPTAKQAIEDSYNNKVYDEFIKPTIIGEPEVIKDNDSIIFINFRPDRAVQLMRFFIFDDSEFSEWQHTSIEKAYYAHVAAQKKKLKKGTVKSMGSYSPLPLFFRTVVPADLCIVAMSEYDDAINPRMHIAYHKEIIEETLAETLSKNGLTQLHIAETEKYNHITRFLNGNRQSPFAGEHQELIKSPTVVTYDEQPEMSALEVTEKCIELTEQNDYDFIAFNFANPDMVGHTGDLSAVVKAIQTVDECLEKLVRYVLDRGGQCYITADHGNADEMISKKGKESTQHSMNPVPFIAVHEEYVGKKLKSDKGLQDIAPTVLTAMGIVLPEEMTGENLLV